MSKHKEENDLLPPLQKKIVLHLAQNGPQTINETVKKIEHSYKPSWIAFNSLEEKKIVKKGKTKEYRGNEYPLYWLTEAGVIFALVEGVSPSELLARTKEIYPNSHNVQYTLAMVPHLKGAREVFRMLLTAILNKSKLTTADLVNMSLVQAKTENTLEEVKSALETMKKYPKEYENFKNRFTQWQDLFAKVKEIL